MIEQIIDRNQLLAIIVSQKFDRPGVHFFTSGDMSQQLAYIQHPVGKIIKPHIHKPVARQVSLTQEVLFIKRGKLRVDLYDDRQQYIASRILEAGDTILLAAGGHGFEVIEEVETIEVKQGPYVGDRDKISFEGISAERTTIEG
jgi:mannose-6-phosphate isomerase-like protein (cupin superfamily)